MLVFLINSDDDEPLSNSSLQFEFPGIIPTEGPVFKTRVLLDSDDINALKIQQKKILSSSTSSIVPCKESFVLSPTSHKQAAPLPYPPPPKLGRPKKVKQAKYPRNEGSSDESPDSSSDELKYVIHFPLLAYTTS
jgi:hypothetical protein